MDQIFIGDEDCSILDVCDVIEDSPSGIVLYRNLLLLALRLGVPSDARLRVEQQLNIKTPFAILYELLESWRAQVSQTATLENLVKALKKIGMMQLGDELDQKFCCAKRPRTLKYITAPVDLLQFMNSPSNFLILCTPEVNVSYDRILETSPFRVSDLKSHFSLLKFRGHSSSTQIITVQTTHVKQILQQFFQTANKYLLITTENYSVLYEDLHILVKTDSIIICRENLKWIDLTTEHKSNILLNCKYLLNINFDLIEETIVGELLFKLIKTPHVTFSNCSIPEAIKYYIPRRIISRNMISHDIFKTKSDHIFLFSGLKRHELSIFVNGKPTDTSTGQIAQSTLTANFIMLETKLDFDTIASKSNRPVHWLHNEDNKLTWIKSTEGMFEIQQFVDKSQKTFKETEFFDQIEKTILLEGATGPVCISDTPGMGKSILLAEIARQLYIQGKIVVFVIISEFLENFKSKMEKKNPTAGKEMLLEVLGETIQNNLESKLLEMILKSKEKYVELLFDGLDEARSEDLALLHDCFREINKWKSARLWVTTRPHLLHELESEMNVLGYNIAAFNEEDQHHFLERFWHETNPQLDKKKLQIFAKKCLFTLNETINSKEKDIAGVPLQCLLIAEVFQQKAINYSTPDNSLQEDSYIPSIQIKSISDLYSRLVKLTFQIYFDRYSIPGSQVQESDLEKVHIHLSLLLLFPNRVKTFSALLKNKTNLTEEDIYKVGILQSVTLKPYPRFIHRTFAEFFISVLVINVLKQGGVKPMPKFLLEEVLKNTSIKFEISSLTKWKVDARSIKHKVISYFIDNMLPDIKPNDTLICLLQQNPKPSHLSNLFFALVYENHLNIFELLQNIFKSILKTSQILTQMVVFVSIRRSSLPFIKIVCNSLNGVDQGELHTLLDNAAFPCSVLDIAARRGSFEIIEYLVTLQNFKVTIENGKAEYLFHHILHQSRFDDETTVSDKVNIMKYLKALNFLNFENELEGKTPILSKNAHFKLILELIKLDANLLATDKAGNTILHLGPEFLSPLEYCNLFDKIPQKTLQKLFQMKSKRRHTPLHLIIKRHDYDDSVLSSFLKHGADFNIESRDSETPLLTAVESNRNLSFLKTLTSYGAGTSNSRGEQIPLLRAAIKAGNIDGVKMSIELGYDVNEKFRQQTPIELALNYKENANLDFVDQLISAGARNEDGGFLNMAIKRGSVEFVNYLLEKKRDLDSIDTDGNTPLHMLLCHCHNIPEVNKILSTFIESKLDVNTPNKQGSSPLVYALESGSRLKLSTLELLEKYGALVETYDFKNGKPFLNTAIENGATDVIDWLISKQADVNASDSVGNTPLHKLLYYCFRFEDLTVKITQNLIEHQANVNIKNNNGKSPLLYALYSGSELDINTIELLERHGTVVGSEIATKLILHILNYKEKFHNDTYVKIFSICVKNGTDITIGKKCSLLYELVREKCIPGVKYLLLQGWDINEKLLHTHSYSAASLSVNDDKKLQIKLSLLSHGIYENSEHVDKRVLLQATMYRGTIEAVKSLCELDFFKVAFTDVDLLFIAVKKLPIELVKLVCEYYIRETGKSIISLEGNGDEKSLLHAALKDKYRPEVSKYLLESHVLDIHKKESRMRDLIHVCVFGTYETNSSLVKETIGILEMLIKRDPSLLHETDEEGRIPLLRYRIHIDVFEWLINHGANKYAVDKKGNSVLQVALDIWWYYQRNKEKFTKLLQ